MSGTYVMGAVRLPASEEHPGGPLGANPRVGVLPAAFGVAS